MKAIAEEEKNNRRRSNNKENNNNNKTEKQEVKHEDVIWPFYLCLDSNFAKTFMCCECKQIPKQTHAFTSENGYIYCEWCINQLIENKSVKQKNSAKVIDNLIKSLRIKCPHCKQSQLQLQLQSLTDNKSQELKIDEIDDLEDDIQINMPPFKFPTSHNIQNNMMMNEGIDENINKKNENIYYCDWIGTINDLLCHLHNDCKFIKINCPLYDLDATLCDVQNLYQHEMKKHLEKCTVTHWQNIVKEINELKSMQLSIILKQQLYAGEMSDNKTAGTITPMTNEHNPTANNSELQDKIEKLDVKIQELHSELKMKDITIAAQNEKINMQNARFIFMQKEIGHIKKTMEKQLSLRTTKYESDITSALFNHSNITHSLTHNKIHEMQQNLLTTQNKIDLISNEMKVKDNLITSLQSQIATMNTMKQSQQQMQPGMVTPRPHTPHMTTHGSYEYATPSYSDPILMSNNRSQSRSYHQQSQYVPFSPPLYQSQSHSHALHRGDTGSKSFTYIHSNDHNKIYRSDSGGNSNMNDENNNNMSSDYIPTYNKRNMKYKIPNPDTLGHNNNRKSMIISKKKKPKLSLYGVGYNEEGEIGIGHRNNLSEFTRLPFCDLYDIISIYYGSQSFFYLTADNELYCCGYNKYGQLGLGHTSEYIIKPTLNKYFRDNNSDRYITFISNSVCSYHTFIKTQTKLYGYGWNNNGQLGIGKKTFKESVPCELNHEIFLNYGNIISISCGFHHTLFLMDNGKVICCGSNQYGQLGFGSNVTEVISPSFIDVSNIINVQCGEYYSCCLDKNGNVLVFGRNDSGQLGLGDSNSGQCIYIATVIQYFKQNGIIVTKIQCGDYHTLCLDSKGCVYAFGNNEYGQIGCNKPNSTFINTPTQCKLPNNEKSSVIVDIDVGAYHSLLLSQDNQIYSFGNNDCNQCSTVLNHKKISSPYWLKKKNEIKCLNNTNIVQIIAGYDCSFIVTNEE